ncbi:MAG: beta-N-acetylhexosaminidase [Bacteroidales bacterium]|jgi:hexosaminidase|nr:beta-N-acetylhexosaminidase [Bacteroidales bacterium]
MKQRYVSMAIIALSLGISLGSCKRQEASDLTRESLIPLPVSVAATGEYFTISEKTDIYFKGESEELKQVAQQLADRLRPSTGFEIEIIQASSEPKRGSIYFLLTGDGTNPADESYELTISKKFMKISAVNPSGAFRAVQTIRQLLPPEIELSTVGEGPWMVPTGIINDNPDYSYRGMMLDVARHFFSVEDVKRVIDLISYYKLNVLHLHLTDDQGWRIEIKSWPNLTAHGGSTEVGGGEGGFFTQEQYSDIVKYAQQRHIIIVPEIDMPGHTNAALASYPELNCDGKARELYTGINVGFSSLCVRKDITYKFVDDVIRELSALTPGPYFHIGGDESHSTKPEDYVFFIEKTQEIVNKYGKTVLGWDEIATTKLSEGSVAQYWAKAPNALKAVEQGAKVLFSPAVKTYLDMQYDPSTKLGLHWAAYIEIDDAYDWDPATLVEGIGKEFILGVEAPLWTETITHIDELEYMVFPRLAGIAEIGWTPPLKRDWVDYRERLAKHGERLKAMGVDFYQSDRIPWPETVQK